MDSIAKSIEVNLAKLQEIVKGREAWHTAVHGTALQSMELQTVGHDLATEQEMKIMGKRGQRTRWMKEEAVLSPRPVDQLLVVSDMMRGHACV